MSATRRAPFVYTVQGQLAWGHCLHILDASGCHIATVQERVLTLLPVFELYQGEEYLSAAIRREFTLFPSPDTTSTCNGWQVEGNFFRVGTMPSRTAAAARWR
jgi:uncharacterized protein YxjI